MLRRNVALFNEAQSRVVITVKRENATAAAALAEWQGVPVRRLGITGGEELRVKAQGGEFAWEVKELRKCWWGAIAGWMEE